MRLDIENFAVIKKASIKLDGITVIAGENNTGKSTVGKILSCIFNSMYQIEDEVECQKDERIMRILAYGFEQLRTEQEINSNVRRLPETQLPLRIRRKKYGETVSELKHLSGEDRYTCIRQLYESMNMGIVKPDFNKIVGEVVQKIDETLKISDDVIVSTLVKNYFSNCFSKQINDAYAPESKAVAELKIKGQQIKIEISPQNGIQIERGISILHEAICIDSPLVMDYINTWEYMDGLNMQEEHLVKKLNETPSRNVLEEILVNTKLESIFRLLDSVTTGKIVRNEEGDFVLEDKDDITFNIQNLSMGIKAFSIIRMLLENGTIKEKDILILDEPEIHLHPEWQLVYAEIIVLLEKYFDLTILITTHSPYFLEAVETYAKKYEVTNNTNYYLTKREGQEVVVSDMTGQLENVYRLLAEPFAKLESIQYSE
ncbi:MAG: AAA family ATPase [Clostridiales bacterium]|nr:AAA family ATPase [Clostridiales bacterium]